MSKYILIADDYEDNRELLRLILEIEGYATREARDGLECVTIAQADPPFLALIDLSMPHLDGWEALRLLREDIRTRSIPCVAITAFAGESDRRRALSAGFDAYIAKPYQSKDLVDTINRLSGDVGRQS
jgi:two-component system cell cycle response regulator DivK